jgi:hypothetical protein
VHRLGPFTGFATRVTLLILLDLLRSPPSFSEVRAARSLAFYVVLCGALFVRLSFLSFDHFVIYSRIYASD